MRYEDEKEVRFERIHTWDLLKEVDRLLVHVPSWKPFDFKTDVKKGIKIDMHFHRKAPRIPWNKKGN